MNDDWFDKMFNRMQKLTYAIVAFALLFWLGVFGLVVTLIFHFA